MPKPPKWNRRQAQVLRQMAKGEPPGVEVGTTRVCRPANEVFTPEELEARIRMHRKRVLGRRA